MNAQARKLAHLLGDADLAEKLVQAGLDTPRKIKAAKREEVEKAIGKEKAGKTLERFKS